VVSRLFEENALSEDVVRVAEIRLDSARWQLAPEVRAFGLRIVRQGASRTAPYADETLSLYVPQGPRLAKVLDELETTRENGESDEDCGADFQTVRGSLSPGRSSSNGYADLILRQSRTDSRSIRQGEECVTQEQPGSYQSKTLRFDGRQYKAAKTPAASD
jgi:hypothetical protein